MTEPDLDIVLPVHNEAGSIEATVRELCDEIAPRLALRLIICEDGSTDGTVDVLTRLQARYPIQLITGPSRKGYSRAVIDGMRASRAPHLLTIDSDGQCDPRDFWTFWNNRQNADIVVGNRHPRRDPLFRRVLSGTFHAFFRLLFRTRVADPSCPYVLISREALAVVRPTLGVLEQGLWWEFTARASQLNLRVREVPVRHRARSAGETQVYRLGALPGIGLSHVLGLLTLWRHAPNPQATRAGTRTTDPDTPGPTA